MFHYLDINDPKYVLQKNIFLIKKRNSAIYCLKCSTYCRHIIVVLFNHSDNINFMAAVKQML